MAEQKVTLTDHRTRKSYELPLVDGHLRAMDLRQIKTSPEDFGMMSYDPAYMNTAACRSAFGPESTCTSPRAMATCTPAAGCA